ncbi:iron dicitrate transport regulator FecR [Leptospira ognonensis]|uniref:Iron dicitrate transport regulator FecR n=1 Tax=Leptospira ognonensis TaxID=2484945 RepID=A0A4R9K9P0_9LEPT|nr:FecR family protein [Leptospira ognonensis]TGL62246.1 iron dicitrate transport regulator FecR [Leptospira ognonensis]
MKIFRSHILPNSILILGLIVFGFSCQKDSKDSGQAPAQTSGEARTAVIAFIKGEVVILREGSQNKPVLGDPLLPTDTVVTGTNGSVEILLGDDGVLKLSKNTSLQLTTAYEARGQEHKTEVNMQYGKLVTVLHKERKNDTFNVVTPTSIAGVRGTSFLTSVESPSSNKAGVPCGNDNCVVRYAVLDGSISVKKPNSDNEIILDKQKEATVGKDTKLSDKMIQPLDSQSLSDLKEMLIFENTKMLQFESLSNELRANSEELKKMDVGSSVEEVESSIRKKEISKNKADEVITTAKSVEESKYIQKDIQKDSLKLPAKESFDKK